MVYQAKLSQMSNCGKLSKSRAKDKTRKSEDLQEAAKQ